MKIAVLTKEDFPKELSGVSGLTIETLDVEFEKLEASEISDQIAASRAPLAVLGPDMDESLALSVASHLRDTHPEVEPVAYRSYEPEFLTKALHSGFRDVISIEEGVEDLGKSLVLLGNARRLLETTLRNSVEVEDYRAKVITFFSPKGGVGKSTLAVNVAFTLARQFPNEVVLVDLDLIAGEVGHLLQVEAASTVGTVATATAIEDPTSLKLSLTSHPSGLLVLPAPNSFKEIDSVDPEAIKTMLDWLTETFKYVIIDTGPGSGEASIIAIQACSELACVTTPEVGAIRIMQRHIEGLDLVGLADHNRHYILNKADDKTGIAQGNVEAVLGQHVSHVVPYEKNVPTAGNQGIPFLETNGKGAAADAIRMMAAQLAGFAQEPVMAAAPAKKGGWFK